ncbi:MAG: SDR family NAD(P)-dependent oxidoreductase, partial [Bacteroidaceae bacterium]|nr:SDR family NAD(P)-dependent oxidoreductase [Bacteroidaceae bacterium]
MKSNLFDIRDRVVVITGGTGVLGREIGKYLALEGAKVALLGRRKEVGDALITDILSLGGEAVFYSCDVMDMASVESVCEKIMARYGRVDALLNAAGGNMPGATITPTGTLFDVQVEEFQKVLNVNLTGTVIP